VGNEDEEKKAAGIIQPKKDEALGDGGKLDVIAKFF
jgi:hypothetical protein